jgi:alpha-tubulin suppressor-like RCC1 family protein
MERAIAVIAVTIGCSSTATSSDGSFAGEGADVTTLDTTTDGGASDRATATDGIDAEGDPDAIVEVSSGYGHSCARRAGGAVSCWGFWSPTQDRQRADAGFFGLLPRTIPTIGDAVELSSGDRQTCVRRRGGDVVCWGLFDRIDGVTLRAVRGLGAPVHIDLALQGTDGCVVQANGQLACWPSTLPEMALSSERVAALVPGLIDVVQVEVSSTHACARLSSGQVTCWGSNEFGQLGDGTTTSRGLPGARVVGLTDAAEVSGSCARRANGQVVCWGSDGLGRISLVPVTVQGLNDVVQISSSQLTACARRLGGQVVCWGAPLLIGETGDWTGPYAIGGVSDAVDISVGALHACALRSDHRVACWGENSVGQLGDGQTGLGGVFPPREIRGL